MPMEQRKLRRRHFTLKKYQNDGLRAGLRLSLEPGYLDYQYIESWNAVLLINGPRAASLVGVGGEKPTQWKQLLLEAGSTFSTADY